MLEVTKILTALAKKAQKWTGEVSTGGKMMDVIEAEGALMEIMNGEMEKFVEWAGANATRKSKDEWICPLAPFPKGTLTTSELRKLYKTLTRHG